MRSARKTAVAATGTTLCDMKPGDSQRVDSVLQAADPAVRRRLEALGFRPDEEVTCVRRAPMGCPILFRVCGADICLRKEQARMITVAGSAAASDRPELARSAS